MNSVEVGRAGDDRAEEARLGCLEAALGHLPFEICVDRRDGFVHPRGVDVGDHERQLEPAEEQGCELRRHQACSDDTGLLEPARLRVRNPEPALDPPLDQVEGIDGGLGLGAGQEIGERLLLGGVALFDRPDPGPGNQLEGAIGRERDTVDGIVDGVPCFRADLGGVGEVGVRTRLSLLLDGANEPFDRVVEELDVVEKSVGEADFGSLGGPHEPVLLQRVRHDQLDRARSPDEPRGELGATPARNDPEEHLGEADVPHRAGDRAEVAVEGDLQAAADRRSVDGGERGEGQRRDRGERLVARDRGGASELGRRHLRELGQVGARGEDERLARQHEPFPAAVGERREQVVERGERGAAEDVRLLPVRSVVHRDERDRPDARRDLLEEEQRRLLSHSRVFSQSRAAPMPRPMQSAVNP